MPTLTAPPPQTTDAIQIVAQDAGKLSVALAEISGHVDSIDKTLTGEVNTLRSLQDSANAMSSLHADVSSAAQAAIEATTAASASVRSGEEKIAQTLGNMTEIAGTVADLGKGIGELRAALAQVASVAADIHDIARTTNLLAVNASIAAARAGDAGRGFMVVAQEIKQLSARTEEATKVVRSTLTTVESRSSFLGEQSEKALSRATAVRDEAGQLSQSLTAIKDVITRVDTQQGRINAATEAALGSVATVESGISSLFTGMDSAARSLGETRQELAGLIASGERLVASCASLGVETVDTPFINAAMETAAKISAAFEMAIKQGQIRPEALFDRRYTPIPRSDPAQVMAPFTSLTDRLLPAIQEPLLTLSPRVVFCAAVDSEGYLPTHNRHFSQPQRPGQTEWNTANCRNRRIFSDRVGLSAARNRKPFLLQAYRRDMGNGSFAMMKDVSAPIVVGGRHWGGLRLAYKV